MQIGKGIKDDLTLKKPHKIGVHFPQPPVFFYYADAKIGEAPRQTTVGYGQSCSQLASSILMSHTSLIISRVFTCELLAVNLHVNKNVATKPSQKWSADERRQKEPV